MTTTAQFLPDDALLDECVHAAQEAGMYLISDGRRVLVSPVVPPGFRQVKITVKDRTRAHVEPIPCAA